MEAGSGTDKGNYRLPSSITLTGTITAKALSISTPVVLTKVYDGTTAASGASVKSDGAVSGEVGTESFTLAVSGGTYPQSDVGAGLTISSPTFTLSASGGAKKTNYSYTLPSEATGDITAKEVTVASAVLSKEYDGGTAITNATLSGGEVTGEAGSESLTLKVTGGSYASADVGVGITISDAEFGLEAGANTDKANYRLPSSITLTGTITAKALSIATPVVLTKAYDGTTAASGASVKSGGAVTGEVGTESFTLTVTGGTYPQSAVGTGLTITSPTFTLSASGGAKTGNYSYTLPEAATGDITKAEITDVDGVTVVSRRVDGTTTATFVTTAASGAGVVTGEVAGFRAGLTVNGAFPDDAKTTAGTYDVEASYTLGDSGTFDASNYTLSDTGDTLSGTVTAKRVLVLSPTATGRVYGESDPAQWEYTVEAKAGSEFVSGDSAASTFFTSSPLQRASGDDVGQYAFSLVRSPQYATGMEAKYTFEVKAGAKYTITAKALTIGTPVVLTKIYDGDTDATGASIKSGGAVTGEVGSESFALTVSGGTYPQSDVGTGLTISSPTFTLTAGNAQSKTTNYSYTLPSEATGDITAKEVTVASAVLSKEYDGGTGITNAKLSGGEVSGEAGSESLTLQVTGGSYASADVGTGITISDPVFALEAGSGTDKTNYRLPSGITLTGTITAKALTIGTPVVLTKAYDGDTDAAGASVKSGGAVSGEVDGESFTLAVSGGTYPQSDVGAGLTITSPTFTLSASGGAKTGNYSYTLPSEATGDITKAEITDVDGVTVVSRRVDGTTTATFDKTAATGAGVVTAELAGFRAGLTVSGTFPEAAKTTAGDYNVEVTYALGDGTGFKKSNYTLSDTGDTLSGTVTDKPVLVLTPTTTTREYGATEPSAYEYTVEAKSGSTFESGHSASTTFFTSNPLTRASGDDVGEYAFSLVSSPAYATGMEASYAFEVAAGAKYTITKKALSISTPVVLTKAYDGGTGTSGASVKSGGAVTGEVGSESFTLAVSGGTYPQSAVGAGLTIASPTFTLSASGGAKTGNYQYTLPSEATGEITAKEVTVASAVLSKVYDGGTGISGATLSGGAVSGEAGTESLTLKVTGGSYASADVGTGITINDAEFALEAGADTDKANYRLPSSITLTGTITAKSITDVDGVTVKTRRVDGTTAAEFVTTRATGTGVVSTELAGFRSGLQVSGTFPEDAKTTAGTYDVAVTYTLGSSGTFKATNYTLSDSGDTLRGKVANENEELGGNKPVLVLTPTTTTREYGATEPSAYAYTVAAKAGSEFLTGDSATSTFFTSSPLTRTAGNDVGEYPFSLVDEPAYAGSMAVDYTFELAPGAKYTITKKALTISTPVVLSKVYDGSTAATGAAIASGGEVSGEVSGESFTLKVTGGSYPQSDVGAGLTISSPTFTLSASGGAKTGNYRYTLPSEATGDITKAEITDVDGVTVVTRPVDGTTGATFDTTGATGTGVVAAELAGFRAGLTVSGTFPDAARTTAGTYNVEVTYTLGSSGAFKTGNYTLGNAGDTLRGTVTAGPVVSFAAGAVTHGEAAGAPDPHREHQPAPDHGEQRQRGGQRHRLRHGRRRQRLHRAGDDAGAAGERGHRHADHRRPRRHPRRGRRDVHRHPDRRRRSPLHGGHAGRRHGDHHRRRRGTDGDQAGGRPGRVGGERGRDDGAGDGDAGRNRHVADRHHGGRDGGRERQRRGGGLRAGGGVHDHDPGAGHERARDVHADAGR